METFDFLTNLQTHAKGQERIFEGMASVFGAPVQAFTPTRIEKGAFARTLRESGSRVRILYQHDVTQPIGKPLELRETDMGLYLRGKLSRTRVADDAWTLMKDGCLDGLSIGFNPISTYNQKEDGESWRHITDLDLVEISVCTFPADAAAKVTSTHGVQLFTGKDKRLYQLAELQLWLEQQRASELPYFKEVFGRAWIV